MSHIDYYEEMNDYDENGSNGGEDGEIVQLGLNGKPLVL
jgi:hypothetical protein